MNKSVKEAKTEQLIDAIVEGIQRKKGLEIIKIDLTKINHTECKYFIICHGNSVTHVDAIAHSVEDTVEELTNESAWHKDGYRNSIWIYSIMPTLWYTFFRKNPEIFTILKTYGPMHILN